MVCPSALQGLFFGVCRKKALKNCVRDMYLPGSNPDVEGSDLTNVDGPYAIEHIEAGVLLFRASENPDLQLGRSTEPNCEVMEDENGELVVMSIRKIAPGEFFCIEHSDDSE